MDEKNWQDKQRKMSRPIRLMMILLLLVSVSGCQSYLTFINGLNEREIKSCIKYIGQFRSVTIEGLTVTGGAALELCKEILE